MKQTEFVHKFLQQNPVIDSRMAYRQGVTRLAARVVDLRKAGVPIESRWIEVPTRFEGHTTRIKEYYLARKAA